MIPINSWSLGFPGNYSESRIGPWFRQQDAPPGEEFLASKEVIAKPFPFSDHWTTLRALLGSVRNAFSTLYAMPVHGQPHWTRKREREKEELLSIASSSAALPFCASLLTVAVLINKTFVALHLI